MPTVSYVDYLTPLLVSFNGFKIGLQRSKYDSSTDALRTLHWLPVRQRINFKILCIVFKCLNITAPKYFSRLIQIKTFGRQTRSANSSAVILVEPFTRRTTFAQRAFSVHGPRQWNILPPDIHSIDNYPSFKRQLKTFLFCATFNN